jgi:hypothetical protein
MHHTLRRAGDDREAVAQHLHIAHATVLLPHHAFVGLPVPRITEYIYRAVCVSIRQDVNTSAYVSILEYCEASSRLCWPSGSAHLRVCVRVCVCARARVFVRVCVRMCVCVCIAGC